MKYLRVEMPDGSKWDVPVSVIAEDREEHCKEGGTDELFESDSYEIRDWAANNMNWEDVKPFAQKLSEGSVDYQDGWVNGEYEIVEK